MFDIYKYDADDLDHDDNVNYRNVDANVDSNADANIEVYYPMKKYYWV